MSVYVNFVSDFPERCQNILADYERRAVFIGREVTHMLAIAAVGLNIPFERLRNDVSHISKDRERYEAAQNQLADLRVKKFIESDLWGKEPGSWKYGEIPNGEGTAEEWKNRTQSVCQSDGKVTGDGGLLGLLTNDVVIRSLRNALAHGNIFTPGEREIEDIVFLSKIHQHREPYRVFVVSPPDFRRFLNRWFFFIQKIQIPDGLMEAAAG
jgi:hypothetical protein